MAEEREDLCHRFLRAADGSLVACGGIVEHWRGNDGHGGSEWFHTCKKCKNTT